MPSTKVRKRVAKKTPRPLFDKYQLYKKAVQSPDVDVEFYWEVFRNLKKKNPVSFREDFCGTFSLSAEWVKLNNKNIAYALDIDPEPMEYGRSHYFQKLKPEQQRRLFVQEKNVLSPNLPSTDIVVAMNFSYFVFRQRETMKKYFRNVYRSLKKDGLFMIDIFGGSQCYDAIEDVHKLRGFTYYWDQTGFDPVTNRAVFHIHFRVGKEKITKVFTYDWRMWSIPELREILEEVGFSKTHIYWEGTNRNGEGNGIFTRTEKGEECLSWIAYIAAEK